MKNGPTLFLFHDNKPLAVDAADIVTMIGVDQERTTILLRNGRDIIIHLSYRTMLELCGLLDEAIAAGQVGANVGEAPEPVTEGGDVPA